MRQSIKHYFSSTNTLLYSYLISLPLLLLYEVLIFLAQPDSEQAVRISVDVWIKTLFSYIGQDVLSITLILVALAGIFVLYRERKKLSSLKMGYFFTMLIEASFYAFFLALLINSTISGLLQIVQSSPIERLTTLQQLALSLGAGLYEELFFRVILVSILLFIFNKIFSKQYVSFASAILLAAVIFSLVHYVGAFGDPFTMGSFLFRFLFGLALNAIYLWRGFGMAAWTHAIYDLMVIVY
ncbi:MAG: CPBP family intramembrane metalloprotease [Aliifodinibius sp.]|nr:CPBP family intramembrane metalloprotease [Fodinibius sp.]NIV12384.1 CPBP family intramembrane metalloprotease [Fodinibius sp.]NIY26047.1 CPBP family intramembrane metalloprotease [Fodinibius sp.]